MKRQKVSTRRLVLRPYTSKDYAQWFQVMTAAWPAPTRWDRVAKSKRWANQKRFSRIVRLYNEWAKKDDYYFYAVFEKKSGTLVGLIDFKIFTRGTHQFANFGYVIFFPYRNQGYGSEAARAGLKIGLGPLKLNRLEAAINLDNKRSQRLAKKIGMLREGIKKRYWYEDGKWVDHVIYVANPEDIGLRPICR